MSSLLYRLGRFCYRSRKLVLSVWGVVLLLAVLLGMSLGKGTDDTITIPGVESQMALDTLGRVFPEVSGTSAQIVVTYPEGEAVDTVPTRAAIADAVEHLGEIDQVITVVSPFDQSVSGAISDDGTTAIVVVQFDVAQADLLQTTKDAVDEEARDLQTEVGGDATVYAGGDAFANRVPQPSATEAVGIVVALLLLFAFFRSIGAAVVPIGSAVLGVAITEMIIETSTSAIAVLSTAPMLSTMIGLAVGIDYALFVLSRHRDQLREGLDPQESAARAIATAGSAVVFAGATVVIALLGLFVAGIPFLTIMGVAAALGVAIAVVIALTVLPAILGFFGERMRPRQRRKARHLRHAAPDDTLVDADRNPDRSLAGRWVALVTKIPLLTIVIVLVIVGVLAAPATSLRLALPGNGSEPVGNAARDTYDLLEDKFGPGFNGPLIVTVNILSSHTPVEDMDGLREDLLKIEGVASVPLSTPNPSGDTGIAQVIPTAGPDSEETAELVQRLRDAGDELEAKYGFRDFAVTGITAVTVDVSAKLGQAMLPFGLLVVGLSLVLLVMVFRSIAVPIKAALGYVLSVMSAFGVTTQIFVNGWGAEALGVAEVGYVVSFLPIILMGVLFGLAMDYEVFLVSRTAEVYAHTGDPERAIREGFIKASPVVTTAALIMLGVFAAFVPAENAIIKPIAVALAVGVFVDAFLVRMTLVPAVLQLFGKWAWWMPTAWQTRLPKFDVEGEGLTRQLRLADWPEPGSDEAISAHGLAVEDVDGTQVVAPLDLHCRPGEFHLLVGREGSGKTAALYALSGHIPGVQGDLKVTGLVLPDRVHEVRQRCTLLPAATTPDPVTPLKEAVHYRRPVVLIDDIDSIIGEARITLVRELLGAVLERGGCVVASATGPEFVQHVIPTDTAVVIHSLASPRTVPEIDPDADEVLS